ncbi:MAG: sugar phosphate isomerase/epimerase [Treponema sp.]|nr:sugar phosphate isomerase/epimerase [Treponema sp.]
MSALLKLRELFGLRQRDSVGYARDPEARAEHWSEAEIEDELARQIAAGFPVGLAHCRRWPMIERAIKRAGSAPGPPTIQADAGELASFRDPDKVEPGLLRLAREGRIRLFFHLPYLFNLWIPFDPSQIRWKGETASVPLARAQVEYLNAFSAGLSDEVGAELGFVVHCGYPRMPGETKNGAYLPAGESAGAEKEELARRFSQNLCWLFDPFIGALSRRGARAKILLENMPAQAAGATSDFRGCAALVSGLDRERYGLCWDSAHSWASGEELSPADIAAAPVGLAHMNGGPPTLRFGCGLDLHGYSALGASIERGTAYPWLADGRLSALPMVFQRAHYSAMLKDSAWLARERGLGEPGQNLRDGCSDQVGA